MMCLVRGPRLTSADRRQGTALAWRQNLDVRDPQRDPLRARPRETRTTRPVHLPEVSAGQASRSSMHNGLSMASICTPWVTDRSTLIAASRSTTSLGGSRATSLAGFGGGDALLAGIKKLCASRCGLSSLEGLKRFVSLQYLYLDRNQFEECGAYAALTWELPKNARGWSAAQPATYASGAIQLVRCRFLPVSC